MISFEPIVRSALKKERVVVEVVGSASLTLRLDQRVDWAEDMICEAEDDEKDAEWIGKILSHPGLADVKEFGLSWDDCYGYLSQLGYRVKVSVY